MFWKKKADTAELPEEKSAQALYGMLCEGVKRDGRIRVEDLTTAAAAITAELCIEAAGEFNPRQHKFVPGSRVFSDRVNQLFAGDSADAAIDALPAESVVGMLRDKVVAAGYVPSDFPPLKGIFEHFAASIGKAADWGKVPLSVPEENRPFLLPLRVAYETRPAVDRIFQGLTSPQQRLRAGVFTLARVLIAVQQAIGKKIALMLALETVNGMAKTAPMTDEAMVAAKKDQQAKG